MDDQSKVTEPATKAPVAGSDGGGGIRDQGARAASGQVPAWPLHDLELDTRGLNCPLPILRTKKGLAGLTSGMVLRVMATDPGAVRDFEAFARQTGNTLLAADTAGPEFVFFLQKR